MSEYMDFYREFEKFKAEQDAAWKANARAHSRLREEMALADSPHPDMPCTICGRYEVYIRGKYPGDDNRRVCPTCLQERLDAMREMVDPDYGVACQS